MLQCEPLTTVGLSWVPSRAVTPARKDPDDVKSEFLKIRVRSERLQRWREAAGLAKEYEDADDLGFSAWVRRAVDEAMEREGRRYVKKTKGGGR
jgi:hypothetical protein